MRRHILVPYSAIALAAPAAAQVTLFDNGPYITQASGGPGGAALSLVPTSSGYQTHGWANWSDATNPSRAADDFTVPAPGWTISGIRFFQFASGSGQNNPFTALNVRIWSGRPGDAGSTIVAGSSTTNVLASSVYAGCYRAWDTTPLEPSRPVFNVDAAFNPPLVLPAGQYWVDWQLTSTLSSGARTVAVTYPNMGQLPGANARVFFGGVWANATDSLQGWRVEFPFQIRGTGPGACYANCDGSTAAPILNVLDFNCFLNKFSAGDPYANCDGSTAAPILNVLDFNCFLNKFSAGCP
jgi:hypothetical protein